ncbi:olfactory receptor 1496-like [Pyxicephalus adspersus]|uniref:olfactory receptor 1496-like n=1 Tax=Pyxicephalus adspersus TaxID=30357 RepID=UPI003B5CA0BA
MDCTANDFQVAVEAGNHKVRYQNERQFQSQEQAKGQYGQQSDFISNKKESVTRDATKNDNQTEVTDFILLGFQIKENHNFLVYSIILVIYCSTVCGNLLIIILTLCSKTLQSPMYFFLSQLSANDIFLTNVIVPNMLNILLNNGGAITFIGCMIQFYCFGSSETFECFLLTLMSYDRYLAICRPLHYSGIMNRPLCIKLVTVSLILTLFIVLIDTLTVSKLQFCRSNIIDHFFCDLDPLLELSCSDTFMIRLEVFLLSTPIILIPSFIIIISYIYIILAILKIQSKDGRQKTFSTCSSHLSVVIIFYGTLFCIYILPKRGQTVNINKLLSLVYTVVTPLLNPIIYGLRSQEIKKALRKTVSQICSK